MQLIAQSKARWSSLRKGLDVRLRSHARLNFSRSHRVLYAVKLYSDGDLPNIVLLKPVWMTKNPEDGFWRKATDVWKHRAKQTTKSGHVYSSRKYSYTRFNAGKMQAGSFITVRCTASLIKSIRMKTIVFQRKHLVLVFTLIGGRVKRALNIVWLQLLQLKKKNLRKIEAAWWPNCHLLQSAHIGIRHCCSLLRYRQSVNWKLDVVERDWEKDVGEEDGRERKMTKILLETKINSSFQKLKEEHVVDEVEPAVFSSPR